MSAGWLKYNIEAGKVWGTLPFPLMKIMPGNETFYHDDYAFNLMNYYEFIADEYISVSYTHLDVYKRQGGRKPLQDRGAYQ